MELYNIVLGLILLVFGRKLFWLFVAIVGFLIGMDLTGMLLAHQPQWVQIVLSIGAGLLGALLAMLAQRVAFAFAGFYAGSYLALMLAQALAPAAHTMVFSVIGGLIGAVLAALIMDQAIIALSCLVGAGAVVKAVDLGQAAEAVVFVVLVLAGAAVQARLMRASDVGRQPPG